MLRPAAPSDVARLVALRDGAGEDALSDPALAGDTVLRDLLAAGAVTVWDEAGDIAGFAAIDGAVIHLLVDPAQRNRGVGRALLAWACERLRDTGHDDATVTLPPGGRAERHYLAAGWRVGEKSAAGGVVLKKPL